MPGWAGGLLEAEGEWAYLTQAACQPEVRDFDIVVVMFPGEVASGRALPRGAGGER